MAARTVLLEGGRPASARSSSNPVGSASGASCGLPSAPHPSACVGRGARRWPPPGRSGRPARRGPLAAAPPPPASEGASLAGTRVEVACCAIATPRPRRRRRPRVPGRQAVSRRSLQSLRTRPARPTPARRHRTGGLVGGQHREQLLPSFGSAASVLTGVGAAPPRCRRPGCRWRRSRCAGEPPSARATGQQQERGDRQHQAAQLSATHRPRGSRRSTCAASRS